MTRRDSSVSLSFTLVDTIMERRSIRRVPIEAQRDVWPGVRIPPGRAAILVTSILLSLFWFSSFSVAAWLLASLTMVAVLFQQLEYLQGISIYFPFIVLAGSLLYFSLINVPCYKGAVEDRFRRAWISRQY